MTTFFLYLLLVYAGWLLGFCYAKKRYAFRYTLKGERLTLRRAPQ